MPSQETEESGSDCGGLFFDNNAAQHSNVCHRTTMAETRLLAHSGGSGVGPRERPAVRGASRVRVASMHHRTALLGAIAGNHLLWRSGHSEKMHGVKHRVGFLLIFSFVFLVFFRRQDSNCCLLRKSEKSVRVSYVSCFFCFGSFPSLGPALFVPQLRLPCFISPNSPWPHLTFPYHMLGYVTLPTIPYRTLLYPALPYHTLLYPTLPYPTQFTCVAWT